MKKICMIIGDPVEHSLSPQMHTAGYKTLHIEDVFTYIAKKVIAQDLSKTMSEIRTSNIHGITVTIPHKVTVMKFLDRIDAIAQKIGAVNTIINDDGILTGYNTDYVGVLKPLEMITDLRGKSVAIVGAGGFARAATYAVRTCGAKTTIYNRTIEHAQKIARDFTCDFRSLRHIEEVKNADIIIQASSVGLESDESLIPKNVLKKEQIVFDAVYVPFETRLLKDAKQRGATIIHGTELLLYQGVAQFEMFTGKKAPIEAMRDIIMKNITLRHSRESGNLDSQSS